MESTVRKPMSRVGKGLASFFAVLLTLSLIPTLLGIAFDNTIFSAKFFEKLLDEQKVYEQIPVLLATSVTQVSLQPDQIGATPNLLAQLPQEKLNQLFVTVLPTDYLKNQANKILDSLFTFINLESTELNLEIDLTPIKENLAGQAGQDAIIQLINSIPDCTEEDLNSVTNSLTQPDGLTGILLPLCKPPEPYLSLLMPIAISSVKTFSEIMPAEIAIGGPEVNASVTQITNSKGYRFYYFVRQLLALTPWISLVIALIIMLLCLRSAKVMTSSLGIPLLITGIVGLIGGIILRLGGGMFVDTLHFSGGTIVFEPLVVQVLKVFVNQVSLFSLIVWGAAFALGLVLTIISSKVKT